MDLSNGSSSSPATFDQFATATLLATLRSGDARPLEALYRRERTSFLRVASWRFPSLRSEDYRDAFQDAVVIFFEKALADQLPAFTVAPGTFLRAIGLRRCQELEKNFRKTINLSELSATSVGRPGKPAEMDVLEALMDSLHDDPQLRDESPDDEELARRAALKRIWPRLTETCRELLHGFYYLEQTLDQLTVRHEYADSATTKVRKAQCVARAKELLRLSASR